MSVSETSYYSSNYKIHKFSGSGNKDWTVPAGVSSIEYLVVGGGSGAGWYVPLTEFGSKYGKAGEVKEGTVTVVEGATYSITVGKGSDNGLKVWNESLGWTWLASNAGGNSSIGDLVVAVGGTASNSSTNGYTEEEAVGKTVVQWGYSVSNAGAGGYIQTDSDGQNGIVVIRYDFPLTVTTDEVEDIDHESFTANGSMTNGDATRRGFCYFEGESGNPTIYDTVVDEEGTYGIDSFTLAITGLTGNSNYRLRAFAENSGGVSYGETIQVCTDCIDGSDGTTTWTELAYFEYTSTEFRGGIVADDVLYVVLGDRVVYVTTTGAVGYCGQLTTTTGLVFMAFNGTDILITDGTVYGKYVNSSTKVMSNITSIAFPASSSCTFIDGYFVVTESNSGRFYLSGIYAVDDWEALRFATAESFPDNLLRSINANNTLWLFGEKSTEVWYNTGDADFPFSRIQGAVIDDGLAAVGALALIKDQIYFLSDKFEVLRTIGYRREKISTLHIETAIKDYAVKSDAVAYEYRLDGHVFFVLTFPTEDKTWVYDLSTNFWHEWQSFVTQGLSTKGKHRGLFGFYLGGKYIVGDYANGNLYELDATVYTDNGESIRRIRRAQTISKDKKYVSHHSVALEFEYIDNIEYGTTPQVGLRYSNDNGLTWSSYRFIDMPVSSTDVARQIWRRLGVARNRIYEIMCEDPCKFVLIGASSELEGFES